MTGNDQQDLYAALLRAYPTYYALQRAVQFRLGQNLAEISLGANLREVVFALVSWATAQGRFTELQALADHPAEGLPPAVPFLAPDLPPGFVARPDEFNALKQQLLAPERGGPVAITATAALTGAGGFGKTTLAAALCHDLAIQAACPDGILWVTLGEQPDIVGGLTKLHAALTDARPGFVDAEDGAQALGRALGERVCLLVVDDVWDVAHLQPFLRGGPHCARLFTTRNFAIAAEAAAPVPVDKMSGAQAVALLIARIEPPPIDPAPFRALAARLGEWPLLLTLANGTLRRELARRVPLAQALTVLNVALDEEGAVAFDQRKPSERNQAVAASLGVSLRQLDSAERACLTELAIFPEDAEVPLGTVGQLWGRGQHATRRLCETLADLSLLRLDLNAGTIRLHDVIRQILAAQLSAPAAVHARLLAVWGDPHTLPDAYAWRHLAYHLARAGSPDILGALLLDFAWLRAKLAATDPGALLNDYEAAPNDLALARVQGALRLAAHILAADPGQLAGQLWGRLSVDDGPEIAALLDKARQETPGPWFRPLFPRLTAPGGPLLCTLTGHNGWVVALAMTADGRLAVSGGVDSTLRVWDLDSVAALYTLQGHIGEVLAVAVTGDGRWVVSGGSDKMVRVWDLTSGAVLHTLSGHAGSVGAVAVTGDGRWVVSGGSDKMVRVWDLTSGAEVYTLEGHTAAIRVVTLTADGQHVISSGVDGNIRIWDLISGTELRTLAGHNGRVEAVAVTGDGRLALTGTGETVSVWDLASGDEVQILEVPSRAAYDGVRAVAVTADGQMALAGGSAGTLKGWDLTSGAEVYTLEGHTEAVRAVAITADGQRAVSGGNDGTVRLWDLHDHAVLRPQEGHTGEVYRKGVGAVAVTADGQMALSGGGDFTLQVWDLDTGAVQSALHVDTDWVQALAVTADGRITLSGGNDGKVSVWDMDTGMVLHTLGRYFGEVQALAVTPDGRIALSGGSEGKVRVWDLTRRAARRALIGHSGTIRAVAVTTDGRRAVSGGIDGMVLVWDLPSREARYTLTSYSGTVMAVAITADGRRAISGGDDRMVRVWDVTRPADQWTLKGHTGWVRAVAVTADGRHVLSASDDRTLRLWDLGQGLEVARFEGDAPFHCCALAADGRTAVVGDAAGVIHFLRVEGVGDA